MLDIHAQTDFNAGGVIGIGLTQSLVNTTEIYRDYSFGPAVSPRMKEDEYLVLKKSTLYSIILTAIAPVNKNILRIRWAEWRFDK